MLGPRTLERLDDCYVRANPEVLFQVVEDEVVLLSMESGEYFGLNEVGARVWILASNGQSIASVIRELLDVYEVTEPDLIMHVMNFLEELASEGLITLSDEN